MEKPFSMEEKKSRVFTVDKVRIENDTTHSLIMKEPMASEPGQFILIWIPGLGEKPFSVAGSNPLMITIADVGKVSGQIDRYQPGDRLWIRGPFGQGYQPYGKDALLVGGGYGASPLLYLAETLIKRYQCACVSGRQICKSAYPR